jgi:HrpA-like RNA helicase
MNYDLIEDVLGLLLVNPSANDSLTPPDSAVDFSAGAVLIFLPGAGEIQTLRERLEGSRTFGDRRRFDIIPMHSTLSPKDQRRAFVTSKKGCQKIILATNIAETSVTIPDVVCVIDSGLVREVHQNKLTSTSTLVTTWCSRASIKQRSGRAGRVQAGICCRLFSSLTDEKLMKDQAIPELQRVPLEEVCLNILASRLGDNCMEFLQQAPQPPSEQSVSLALGLLKEVGAIDSAGHLTPLGHHLSKLPVDVRLGKMLILAAMFRCLDPVLTVTASLSCKSPFPVYSRDSLEAQTRHRAFKHGTSDFWTTINVWSAYQSACSAGKARKFCDENYLSRSALLEIGEQKEQYLSLLCQIGFVLDASAKKKRQKVQAVPPFYDENSKKEAVVHAVICAGLYPNVARVNDDWKPNEVPNLMHNKERVHIHKSSVNSAKMSCLPSEWVVFYEKFATHRVYISDTTFVHPFSLLLFGGPLLVKHREKRVMVGEWIEIPVAAQTGVLFRELRTKMDRLLTEMMEQPHANECKDLTSGIVKLIESS